VSAILLRALALVCLLLALLAPSAAAKPAAPPQPAAEAWVLIDARDGERLAAHDPTAQRSIASATKLMTAYLALREKDLDKRVAAPDYQPAAAAESLLNLEAGERLSYRELLYALILASANDGAVTVAEGVSGSVDRFVAKMNSTAERLGLDDTSYANPIGLDEAGNYSSAADLARLATILLEDPFFRKVANTEAHTVETDRASRPIVTRDDLLTRVPWVTGVKTGFTGEAGNVLVGSGERKGVRLIAVVLGAPTELDRDNGVLSLLEYGFSLYRPETVVRGREEIADPPVDSGGTVELLARKPISISVRRDQDVETAVDAPDELSGPVRKGERVGTVRVNVDGRQAGSSPLVAARSAPAPSLGDGVRNNFPTLAVVGGALIVIVLALVIVRRTRREEGSGAPG
jgi:D-alanyl-D-alanine carboxypeptidase (penicillin-binding protein 5/6)